MTVAPEQYTTVPLFEGLKPLEVMKLLKIAEDIEAGEGQVIVSEGESGDGFFVIAKGAFVVRKAGLTEVIARLQELSFFGEMALVTQAPRNASVICVDPGRLKKFPTKKFEELLEEGDLIAYKVIRNMARILAQRLARLQVRFVAEMSAIANKGGG